MQPANENQPSADGKQFRKPNASIRVSLPGPRRESKGRVAGDG